MTIIYLRDITGNVWKAYEWTSTPPPPVPPVENKPIVYEYVGKL